MRAGFPSPADDHLDVELDLYAHVVRRPASTYFVRAEGDSMLGDGIHDGDLLVVDRSLAPLPGRALMATPGRLNARMGHDTVRFGLPGGHAAWPLRCEYRTSRYATRWDELMTVKVR